MAQKLQTATGYSILFKTGQGVAGGPASYFVYATDMDTNFVQIQTTVNALVDEISAVAGPNSVVGVDLMIMDDPNRLPGAELSGLIGIGSYSFSIAGATITIEPGQALIGGNRVSFGSQKIIVNSIGAGDAFLALNSAGEAFLESLVGQRSLDLYRFDSDGSSFLTDATRLANVMNDGDEYENSRKRIGTDANTPQASLITLTRGSPDIVTRNAGSWADDGFLVGETIHIFGSDDLDGSYVVSALPTALSMELGTLEFGADEAESVLVHISAGSFGYHDFDQVHERLEDIENLIAGAATVLATPALFRVKGVSTESVAEGALLPLAFADADIFDVFPVGGTQWHNAGASAPQNEEFTVPVGGTGLYFLCFTYLWSGASGGTLISRCQFTINGTNAGPENADQIAGGSGDYGYTYSGHFELVAEDVVRVEVFINDLGFPGPVAIDATFSIVRVMGA